MANTMQYQKFYQMTLKYIQSYTNIYISFNSLDENYSFCARNA